MCKAFSCIVSRSKKVYWKLGLDSHEDLRSELDVQDEENNVPIEIVPKDYLGMKNPLKHKKDWGFKFDDKCPDWWKQSHETATWNACNKWYESVKDAFDWGKVRNPINPLEIKSKKVTKVEISLLAKWYSVWDSVRGSVWDSVYAYIGSLFKLSIKWKYTEKLKVKGYPFASVVKLWKKGLVPSFDGKIWRLHAGKDAKVVYQIRKEKLKDYV